MAYYDRNDVVIHCGDSLEVLRGLPDGLANCCVTSPPYWGLRDYGVSGQIGLEPTPEAYVARMVEVFREVRRVLRDDGTLWLNLGDSYTSGGRDTFETWAPDSKQATHTAIKEAKRAPQPQGLKPKDLIGIPWRVAFALQADGWYLRSDIIWHKPNPMPESVTDRPTKSHEYIFLLSKGERYFYDHETIKEPAIDTGRVNGRDGREEEVAARPPGSNPRTLKRLDYTQHGRNKRSVWTVATQSFPEAHFATFPEKLIEPCILAGCPKGGIVLDPFGGSGTTAVVARKFFRQAVLIELNEAYCEMAVRRIESDILPLEGVWSSTVHS